MDRSGRMYAWVGITVSSFAEEIPLDSSAA
jgi:hypothetical protein